ncbi:AMP-binding protein [Pseudoalteromonas sp. SSDWG2]|uniref:AMP-binding protein n=1 Tax=Pseudoalteromonas sp. SSDWG2 TaxID=3139391 RepID=UPI003BAC429E
MMSQLINAWHGNVIDDTEHMNAAIFWQEVERLATHLRHINPRCVALELDNSIAWLVADFALMQAGIVSIPLPHFFSTQQRQHALQKAQPGLLIRTLDDHNPADHLWQIGQQRLAIEVLEYDPENPRASFAQGTQKITFTSGSTGHPKGVCLSAQQLLQVAASLVTRCGQTNPVHLCLLPLAVLLENVAGVYAPMLAGGTVHVPSLASLGFDGTALTEPHKLLATVTTVQSNTLILVPELLKGLVLACESGWQPPSSLQFIAVGGAKVAPELIVRARALGLPVYQGYGLSEAGSVVSLADSSSNDIASVGTPLDHVEYEIVDDELVIKSPKFLGYLGDAAQSQHVDNGGYQTGDRVSLENGELHIRGRIKNQIILSNGRNVSPEWPESLLLSNSALSQAVVVGEGEANLCALIYCHPNLSDEQLQAVVNATNTQLPCYAQIANFMRLSAPLSIAQDYLSANQRPKRDAINHGFADQISQLFQEL